MRHGTRFGGLAAAIALVGAASAPQAAAQTIAFSIDYTGLTVSAPDCAGVAITEGDILVPATPGATPAYGPLPSPCILIPGGPGGLGLAGFLLCAGHPPGTPCAIEVDALSFGRDHPVQPIFAPAGTYAFSVDECSTGVPGTPRPAAVWTEAPFGDASADVFSDGGLPPGPLGFPAPAIPPGHVGLIDGNGLPSGSAWVYPGLGLVEPDFPLAVDGDDVDAIDLDNPAGAVLFPVYFSVDGNTLNPCTALPRTGTAFANGVAPGDVLITAAPGGPPAVYAPAAALGLDLLGAGTDDLDALALWENGVPGFQPSPGPYVWGMGAGPDMLLFSVARGSAVVGAPDSLTGTPIEPGDILIPPVAGGLSPFPAIFVAGEWLGLATARVGLAPDDLDALDTRFCPEAGTPFCFGDGSGTPCPCGNFGLPGNGCDHSFGFGGGNLTGGGKPHVAADTLVLTASNLPPTTTILFFQAAASAGPFGAVFGDGLLCTAGPVRRLGARVTAGGTASWGGPAGTPPISIGGALPPAGGTRYYQGWYRNQAPAFCTPSRFNLTNGYAVTWVP
jgi:hypothetical protein